MVMPKTNVITASGDLVNITGTVFAVPTAITFLVAQSGLAVQMSGQGVLINGQQVEISGQPVLISGQTVIVASGAEVTVLSGAFVIVQSGVNVVGSLTASVSGQTVQLASGTIVVAQSGLNVVVESGLGVIGSFTANVSGQPVSLTSGTIVIGQSGLNVIVQSGLGITPPKSLAIRVRAPQMLSDTSGGVTLVSGLVTKALIRSLDGDVYIGGVSGIDMPYSGFGMLLQRDDVLSLPLDNFNLLNGCAIVSGYRISYGGVQ